jgi:hypothetical protein
MEEATTNVPSTPPPFAAVTEIESADGPSRITEGKNEGTGSQMSEVVKPWHVYKVEQDQELKRTMVESTDSTLRLARDQVGELQAFSTIHYRTMLEYVPKLRIQYSIYEDDFF